MPPSILVVRTRRHGNQPLARTRHAAAAHILATTRSLPAGLYKRRKKSAQKNKQTERRKKRLAKAYEVSLQPARTTTTIRTGSTSPIVQDASLLRTNSATGQQVARMIQLGVIPELAYQCTRQDAEKTLRPLESIQRRRNPGKIANKSRITQMVSLGVPSGIASHCSYRDAVLTLLAIAKRRCSTPPTRSQIQRMVKLGVRLDAACRCSSDEAEETVRTLERHRLNRTQSRTRSLKKLSRSTTQIKSRTKTAVKNPKAGRDKSKAVVGKNQTKIVRVLRRKSSDRGGAVGASKVPFLTLEMEEPLPQRQNACSTLEKAPDLQGSDSVDPKVLRRTRSLTLLKARAYRLPPGFENVRHVRKFVEAGKWILTTKKGVRLGVFDSEAALDEAWRQCQQNRNLQPPLAKGRKRSSPSLKTRRIGELGSMPIAGFDPKRPWSDRYDMPEYDFE